MSSHHFDSHFIRNVKSRTSLVEVIGRYVPLRREGVEHMGLCPFHTEKTPSFTVNDRKGFYHCFGCGAHGDQIDFLRNYEGWDFMRSLSALADMAGLVHPDAAASPDRLPARRAQPIIARQAAEDVEAEKVRQRARAETGFYKASDSHLAPVEMYLLGRGIDVRRFGGLPWCIRYQAKQYDGETGHHHPCMVTAVTGPDGKISGLHRTFLACRPVDDYPREAALTAARREDIPMVMVKSDRMKSAKKMMGACFQGAARLADPRDRIDGKPGKEIAICEGIETGLSIMQAMADVPPEKGGGMPVWAALSFGNMAGSGKGKGRLAFRPDGKKRLPSIKPDMARPGIVLPDDVTKVWLCPDGDNKDPEVARCLLARSRARFQRLGLDVVIVPPAQGKDFNDMLLTHDDRETAA